MIHEACAIQRLLQRPAIHDDEAKSSKRRFMLRPSSSPDMFGVPHETAAEEQHIAAEKQRVARRMECIRSGTKKPNHPGRWLGFRKLSEQ
jgi:hypothetical protein